MQKTLSAALLSWQLAIAARQGDEPNVKTLEASGRALVGASVGWVRYGLERFVVLPAADVLPRRWALRVADAVGFLDLLMPATTSRIALREAGVSTGARGWQRFLAAGRRLGGPRRDLVVLRRLRRRREHPRDWNIVEVNAERIHQLMNDHRAFVVATGHFHHAADLAVGYGLYPLIGAKGMRAEVPVWRFSPCILRERLQNHLLFGIGAVIDQRDDKQYFPAVGDPNLMPAILENLAKPDGCVRIFIDAIWDKPRAHLRPFAGMNERAFALGAARIARLAQCPVILEASVYQPDGSVLIEWGPCIEPPRVDDVSADTSTMDQLVDALEIIVGRYAEQYLHPIGWDRTWNAGLRRWERTSPVRRTIPDSPRR